jgi:hypothetical protein
VQRHGTEEMNWDKKVWMLRLEKDWGDSKNGLD